MVNRPRESQNRPRESQNRPRESSEGVVKGV
nr:MAG TPA: hypothetical protein [Siphoviridae sp. ctYuc6]